MHFFFIRKKQKINNYQQNNIYFICLQLVYRFSFLADDFAPKHI